MILAIIPPKISSDFVSNALRDLTKRIKDLGGNVAEGLLGGEFGYGAAFENETFSMHPFCWCEKDGCKYCDDGEPLFLHKASGQGISWHKYIGRGMEYSKQAEWTEIFLDCISSLNKEERK